MRNYKNRKAFTIVEMVIVIAVIAILATVLIPTISGVIQMANKSADQQFAASLNVQLALWEVDNGQIADEYDLRDAINYYYGEQAEDGDYFATMTTKSVKQGNYYWYDYTNKVIEVGTVEEMAGKTNTDINGPTMSSVMPSVEESFSPASFRAGLVMGYYLMGGKGYDGDLLDVISQFGALAELEVADPDAYTAAFETLYALQTVLEEADENDPVKQAVNTLVQKAENTVVNCETARYTVSDQMPDNVWSPKRIETINPVETYRYNKTDKDTDDGSTDPIVLKAGTIVELPNGVAKITTGAILEVFVDENGEAVELHINTTEDKLGSIFEAGATDCVIVLSTNKTEYEFEGDITIVNKQTREPIADNLTVSGIEALEGIEIKYDNGTVAAGNDDDYFYGGTLYLAWDFDGAKASLEGKLSDGTKTIPAGMANWTVSEGALIDVNRGVITLKEGATPDAQKASAIVTATLKSDESKTYSINVQLVFPTALTWKLDNTQYAAPVAHPAFDLIYTEATEYTLALAGVTSTQDGYVKMNSKDLAISFATAGDLFSISRDKLVLDPDKIETNPTQKLTVTYGSADNAYITQEYTVTAKDHSSVGVKKNQITDTVTMGDYLFRVGNGNTFTLGKLFSAVTEGKAVNVQAVNIYDASKTSGTNGRGAIATSGSGFTATYTANSNWANGTIKFSGTGVAIIEVVTDKGPAELAVEVVNGKNVIAAGDFSGATNYVLLNNITWGTAKDVAISGTIYGNGFAINATTYLPTVSGNTAMFKLSGTIDNLVINGPVYPEVSYSGEQYYISGIYATGDAKITNTKISGFRQPIMANGTSLYLENTTLVGGNYGNLWLQTGTLTLKDVTTVQVATPTTIGSGNVLGVGIVVNSGVSASNVTVVGNLTQYNWASQDDASNMDSDIRSLVNTILNNSELTHTVNGKKYINSGILFLGQTGTVNNAKQTNKANYKTLTASGSFMGVQVSANVYTHASTNGAITAVPTYAGYTPSKQAVLEPTFKYSPTLGTKPADLTSAKNYNYMENGVIYIGMDTSKETFQLDLSKYTISKYAGQTISVTSVCSGGTVSGNTVTFSAKGTYTITFTVKDNTSYKADGTRQDASTTYTHTVTVVVANTVIPSAVIDVSGVDKTIYMGLEGKTTDTDYAAFFAILKGLKITDYNESGDAYSVTIPSDSYPAGLTVTVNNSEFTKEYKKDGVLYLGDSKANNNNDYSSITVTYKYTGTNKVTVTATVTYTGFTNYKELYDERTSGGGCVTPDTLVMLADGTQKEIQYVTYEDQLMVWNFYEGKHETVPAAIIFNMGTDNFDVLTLIFDDGTTVKTINGHRFFDKSINAFALINTANVEDFVGHEFAKVDGDSYKTVKLVDYSIAEQYTTSYSIMSAYYYNFIVEGMLSDTFHKEDAPLFDYFQIGDAMMYDADQMNADVEKYGLYTYEDFSDYLTYEQFVALNVQYLKIAVGKGQFTYEGILGLIATYLQG